jgi:hypothetical protein
VRDTILRVSALPTGVRIALDHPDPLGQRDYVADVAMGSLLQLRVDGGTQRALCLESGHEGPVLETGFSFGSLGTYWLAIPRNGCRVDSFAASRQNPCP